MTVDVAIRATNAALGRNGVVPPEGGTPNSEGKRVLVKANSREEVRFPVSTMKAGIARFQIAVTSGKHTDAAEISLPVEAATTEAFEIW